MERARTCTERDRPEHTAAPFNSSLLVGISTRAFGPIADSAEEGRAAGQCSCCCQEGCWYEPRIVVRTATLEGPRPLCPIGPRQPAIRCPILSAVAVCSQTFIAISRISA